MKQNPKKMNPEPTRLAVAQAKRVRYLGIFALIVCAIAAHGQPIIRSTKSTRLPITFEADIRFTYDDNIFLYSEKNLKEFQRSVRPYRFPFETYDDFITTLTGALKIRPRLIRRKTSIISLRYRLHHYAVNPVKSYQFFSINLAQNLIKTVGVEAGYLFLPKYLIRYYKDPLTQTSPPTYIGCEFAEHLLSTGINYRIKNKISLNPFYKFELDDYNRNFDHYDTKAHRFGLEASYSFIRQIIKLSGKFEYKIARAQGPVPDISYDQWAWFVGLKLNPWTFLRRFRGLSFTVNYGQEQRDFVTSNPSSIDPFHTGREDKIQNFGFGVDIPLTRIISIDLSYGFEKRNVSSPYKEEIDDIKDYKNNKIKLEFSLRRF
ncbi:MAG: hypothetical protein OEW70_02150 [candidate division WOR-3 bacterium]|nr:hypothetical protein [candidate division WOR-3 bacterium]